MGKAGRHVPYKIPPPQLQRQERPQDTQTDATYLPGRHVRYKAPPKDSGPKREGPAPTPTRETPREAMASEPHTFTTPYRPPPPQSSQRARSPQHDVQRAEPIRNTTRPTHANEGDATPSRAAVGRDGKNVTSAEHSDRENDQTAHASRPTETTQVDNREASVAPDAPAPPRSSTAHDTQR